MGGRAPLVGGFVFGFERSDVFLGVDCFDSRFAVGLRRVISRAQRGVIVALVGVPGVEDRKVPAQRLRMVQPAIGVSDHSGKMPLKVGHRLPRQGRAFPERFERALRMALPLPGRCQRPPRSRRCRPGSDGGRSCPAPFDQAFGVGDFTFVSLTHSAIWSARSCTDSSAWCRLSAISHSNVQNYVATKIH